MTTISAPLPSRSGTIGASDMARFDDGVSGYIIGKAIVTNAFPVDWRGNADICCDQCYYFRRTYKTCGLNGEVCQYPNKYVGASCPLQTEEETNNDKEEN